ncbi:transporter [Neobacillus drentensis]|uniref:transporter n=1 Tax=Neobacillus drentensis TaxID=220684 RepID=UPI0030033262
MDHFNYPQGHGRMPNFPYDNNFRQQTQPPPHGGGHQPPPHGGGHQQPPYGGGHQPPPHGGGHQQPPYGGYHPPYGGGPHYGGAPTGPPPTFIPHETVGLYAVDPGGIRHCLYRYTYIWLRNGRNFWYYPTYVGRTSIAGYRWSGYHWEYYGMDLSRIRSFSCQ